MLYGPVRYVRVCEIVDVFLFVLSVLQACLHCVCICVQAFLHCVCMCVHAHVWVYACVSVRLYALMYV